MRTLTLCLCLSSALASQTSTKIVPASHANVEGNSSLTRPFGLPTAGVQILVDAPSLTLGAGQVTAVSFRSNGVLLSLAAQAGYIKGYKVTCWTTSVTAAAMTTTPANNIGTATPVVVYASNLSLPTVNPGGMFPYPFSARFPFSSPYPYNGASGNFLMQVETTDTITPPTTWQVDTVMTHRTNVQGLAAKLGEACLDSGKVIVTTLGPTQLTTAVPGGNLVYKLGSTQAGKWPTVLAVLGFSNSDPGFPIDMSAVGLPGCFVYTNPVASQTILENVNVYPDVTWPIPNIAALTGATVYVQNLGVASLASLAGAITTDAFAVTFGTPGVGNPIIAQCIHSITLTSWSMNTVNAIYPVMRFEGTFP